eukprot:155671-Prymnesium_polylepis.1
MSALYTMCANYFGTHATSPRATTCTIYGATPELPRAPPLHARRWHHRQAARSRALPLLEPRGKLADQHQRAVALARLPRVGFGEGQRLADRVRGAEDAAKPARVADGALHHLGERRAGGGDE